LISVLNKQANFVVCCTSVSQSLQLGNRGQYENGGHWKSEADCT